MANSFTDSTGVVWTVVGGVIQYTVGTTTTADTTTAGVTSVVLLPGTPQVAYQSNNIDSFWYFQSIPATPGAWTQGSTTSPLTSPGVVIPGLALLQSYNIEAEVSNAAGMGLPCAPITAATTNGTGNFTVSFSATRGGNIITDPSGNEWYGRGVDVAPWGRPVYQNVALSTANGAKLTDPLTASFTGINMYGIYIFADEGIAVDTGLFPIIDALTAAGIVVILHSCSPSYTGAVPIGADLTKECIAAAGYASHYINNPRVWFETSNEPEDASAYFGAVADEQLAVYNAIRGTSLIPNFNNDGTSSSNSTTHGAGSSNIVVLNWAFGGGTAMKAPNYAQMTNVVQDNHIYPGQGSGFSAASNRTTNAASTYNFGNFPEANGYPLPCIWGEDGDSFDTNNGALDTTLLPAIFAMTPYENMGTGTVQLANGTFGKVLVAGWAIWGVAESSGASGTIYSLQLYTGTNSASGTLTAYGQQVASAIAAGAGKE